MLTTIIKMSYPIALANVLSIFFILIHTYIVSLVEPSYLYVSSLFLPLNFWVIGVAESLRVPAMAFSATVNSDRLLNMHLAFLLIILLMLSSPLLGLRYFPPEMGVFITTMLLASMAQSFFVILTATLNGLNRSGLSLVYTITGICVTLILTMLLLQLTGLGVVSVPMAGLITYLTLCVVIFIYLISKKVFILTNFQLNLDFRSIARLALPVWLQYFMLSIYLWALNRILILFGSGVLAGFGIAYRLQTLIMLPAISIAMGVGILINRNPGQDSLNYFLHGILICLVIYAVIALLIYTRSISLIQYITHDKLIITTAREYLHSISLSYVFLALALFYTTILDQLGYGMRSMLLTSSIFAFEIALICMLWQFNTDYHLIYWTITLGNILFGLLSIILMLLDHTLIKPIYLM